MSFLMVMALSTANCCDRLVHIENAETSVELVSNRPSKGEPSMGPCEDQERAPLLKSISELQSLSSVMYTFHDRWNELQKHLEFIDIAIQNREKQLVTPLPSHQSPNSGPVKDSRGSEPPSLTSKEACRSNLPGLEKRESERNSASSLVSGNAPESELETLCRNMCCRALRKHIVAHLSQTSKLRHEVPTALKSAANPAKLVLECVGKFYLQGRKAFAKNSGMIPSRQAAILILEYFLLMDSCNQTDQLVKKEAEQAALAWRKRLIVEGGILGACDEDARGLLLLVACFGVPTAFTNDDLIHLIQLSSAHELAEALRKSTFLLAKMPDIIECMTRKGMEVEAVDTIYIFAIEDKFPPQKILAPFLKNLKEAQKKTSDLISQKDTNQKQLEALKSLQNCLKVHRIEPTKIIPHCKLNENITNLEKEITKLNKKISSKRKAEELSFQVSNDQEFKHPRLVVGEALIPIDSPFSRLHEPRVSDDPLVYQLHSSRYSDRSANRAPPASSSWSQEYVGRMGSHVGFPGSSYTIPSATIPSIATPMHSSERAMDRNFAAGPTEVGAHQYRGAPSSLVEGFPGSVRNSNTPSLAAATSRSSASDLYNFADRLEGDYARGSYKPGASYRSSFFY